MKLNLFKRSKVENAADIENMVVVLPKSGREVSITQLVNEADAADEKKKNGGDKVKVDGVEMTVAELVEALQNAKKKNKAKDEMMNKEDEDEDDAVENEDDEDDAVENDDEDDAVENDDEETARVAKEHEEKEVEDAKRKNAKAVADKKAAKKKADAVRNAHTRGNYDDAAVKTFDPTGGVQRGKAKYGT